MYIDRKVVKNMIFYNGSARKKSLRFHSQNIIVGMDPAKVISKFRWGLDLPLILG